MHQAETSAGEAWWASSSEGAGWPITGGRREMNLILVLDEYVRDLM